MDQISEDGLHECVSFLLVRDGWMLLEKRADDKPLDPGKVAIPGGHIELGETVSQALDRELVEELGVNARNSAWFCSLYYEVGTERQRLHYFVIGDWTGDITALEAAEVFWHSVEDGCVLDIDVDRVALAEYHRTAPARTG